MWGFFVTKAGREGELFKFVAHITTTSTYPPLLSVTTSPYRERAILRLLTRTHFADVYYINFFQPSIHVHQVTFKAHIRSSVGGSEHGWYNATNILMYGASCQQILVTQGQSDTL